LALAQGKPVSADRLIEDLWGDDAPAKPSNALQALVAHLRRALGPESVVTTDGGYALSVDPDDIDTVRFDRAVCRARVLAAEGNEQSVADLLRGALELLRGEPLAEFAYTDFAQAERVRLEELALEATETRVEADLGLGRHRELITELEVLCHQYPLRERLWELLMVALYRSDRQAEALRTFAEARSRLVDELGIEPGMGLRQMEARVLAQDPSLAPSVAPPAEPALLGNLREHLTTFVGRDDELRQLDRALETSRLVTLIGPGGVGKTRLATHAAFALRASHRDGAWLIELAGVGEPHGVAQAVAAGLRVTQRDRPGAGVASTEELIEQHLVGRSLVIVLDNCEHVIDAAAMLAERLISVAPGVLILATSREPLGVPGEVLVPLSGLGTEPAAALFADRAAAVRPDFTLDGQTSPVVAEMCRRLDGLPLAIELAAARLRALPLHDLAARLDDRFHMLSHGPRTAPLRHQTLRAVVEWSYQLLFTDEQRLFRRLAVFAGPFTIDDAQAVCSDDDIDSAYLIDLLLRLVDKSLVEPIPAGKAEGRYTLLQTLRQYAQELLHDHAEASEVAARHGTYYRTMAASALHGLRGPTGPATREMLTAELANLRVAFDWHLGARDADGALTVAVGLSYLWFLNGEFLEAIRWLDEALALSGGTLSDLQAIAHVWRGYFIGMSSSLEDGARECSIGVTTLRTGDDSEQYGEALLLYAGVIFRRRQFDHALALCHDAGDALRACDDRWLLGLHDLMIAFILTASGRLEEAEDSATSSLDRFERAGEVWFTFDALNTTAGIAEARGDLDRAAATYEALLDRCQTEDTSSYRPLGLVRLAKLRAYQNDNNTADALYHQALGCITIPWLEGETLIAHAAVARRLGDLDRARGLLDAAGRHFQDKDLNGPRPDPGPAGGRHHLGQVSVGEHAAAGRVAVLCGLAWTALAAGEPDRAGALAAEAATRAADLDTVTVLLADTVAAAVTAARAPSREHQDLFADVVRRRAELGAIRIGLVDEPDVVALSRRLAKRPVPTAPNIS
jgi:predicted ATPase/DNA-binding SARP family transcriptional activator